MAINYNAEVSQSGILRYVLDGDRCQYYLSVTGGSSRGLPGEQCHLSCAS